MDNRNFVISRARHPDDDPLESSRNEIESFRESLVWRDMVNWMEERKEYLQMQLRTAESMPEVKGIQEALDQIDDIIDLPDKFIEQLEAEDQLESEKGTEV